MTQHLLTVMKMPAIVAKAEIDAEKLRSAQGEISKLKNSENGISFEWKTKLPMPMNPAWDTESIALEKVHEKFNRLTLKVHHLKTGKYRVMIDGNTFGKLTLTEKQLRNGINLTTDPNLSINNKSQQVLSLVAKRRRARYANWRSSLNSGKKRKKNSDAISQKLAELGSQIEKSRQRVTLRIKIVPAD